MSLSAAVTAQFKLILRHKCNPNPQWNAGCVFHLSTAAFGYFLILVVALAQIPLIYKVLKYKEGKKIIGPFRIGLLALMSSNNVAYAVNKNLPISTWGEGVIQLLQYLIIINLLLIHQGRHKQAVAFTLIYVTVMVGSLTPIVPTKFLVFLKVLNIFIDILTKMYLMYRCHKNGAPVDPVSKRRQLFLLNMWALGRLLTACVHSHDALLTAAYGQESLSTLALTTVVMVTRRRRTKKAKLTMETEEDEGIGSSNDESFDKTNKRIMRVKRVVDDEESSSGNEDINILFNREKRRTRRLRRVSDEYKLSDEDGEISSGVEDLGCVQRRKDR